MRAITISGYSHNWGEVLKEGNLFFINAGRLGPRVAGNRIEWRVNAAMNDGVTGGWYDAGDHVKFNLPIAYEASMFGWGEYEYKSAL